MSRWRITASGAGLLLLAACGKTPAGPDDVYICWVNQIHFDGVRFTAVSRIAGREITDADLGSQLSTVRFTVDGNIKDSDYRLQDGDATYLEQGTPVFAVKGYSARFRRAARANGRLYLYEAHLIPAAARGAELLDIGGKVDSVGVFSRDHGIPLGVVSDAAVAGALAQMVLQAPVEIKRPPDGEIQILAFYLTDGTSVVRSYRRGPNLLSDWIALPGEFRTAVEEAILRGDETPWTPQPLRSVGTVCGLG